MYSVADAAGSDPPALHTEPPSPGSSFDKVSIGRPPWGIVGGSGVCVCWSGQSDEEDPDEAFFLLPASIGVPTQLNLVLVWSTTMSEPRGHWSISVHPLGT